MKIVTPTWQSCANPVTKHRERGWQNSAVAVGVALEPDFPVKILLATC